jgi:proteasome activator-like protein
MATGKAAGAGILMSMSGNEDSQNATEDAAPVRPQIVDDTAAEQTEDQKDGDAITQPSRLIRVASMTRALLDEARQAPLDEAGRARLLAIYDSSLEQLKESLGENLQEELSEIFQPITSETPSESELRIVQAQLVGWLEGLFHGIQASLWSQQASMAAQLEEMRRRPALEKSDSAQPGAGQYL